ncbi:MAG: hypothetical protein WA152_03335 [Microgenomates group bacterium]
MKNKFTVIGIILTTVILAAVAIFTATRLYQTRDTAVAPNAPSSRPAASSVIDACQINFTILTVTPSPSPSPSPSVSPSPSPSPSPVPQCNTICSDTSDCPSNLTCYKPNGATSGNCRNTQCTTAANCVCATVTPTATATTTATATATVTASPNPQCNYACTSNSNCPSSMICYIPSGSTAGNCRNTQCLTETDCTCNVTTTAPTTQPTLPVVGTSWPTLLGTGLGVLVILGSLLLAL